MILPLHNVQIRLDSNNKAVNDAWRTLFDGWPLLDNQANGRLPDYTLRLTPVRELPPLPSHRPYFTDTAHTHNEEGILSVYKKDENSVLLHYLDGALVELPLTGDGATAEGWMTPNAFNHGRFEDVTFTSLAPALRRRGYFWVHAFAAAKNGRAVLIVGSSGSGKTTTGLNLLLNGWQLLSNDAALLEQREDGVYALPTPGAVSVRQPSLEILPELKALVADTEAINGVYDLSSGRVADGDWAEPTPVDAIYFPQIHKQWENRLEPQHRAVALAQLMAESVDQWDQPMLGAHMDVLKRLIGQTAVYTLHLGQNTAALPTLLSK